MSELRWHTITSRPMDEDEKARYIEEYGEFGPYEILENTPECGDECIVEYLSGYCGYDVFDADDFCYWESADEVCAGQKWVTVKELMEYLDAIDAK